MYVKTNYLTMILRMKLLEIIKMKLVLIEDEIFDQILKIIHLYLIIRQIINTHNEYSCHYYFFRILYFLFLIIYLLNLKMKILYLLSMFNKFHKLVIIQLK